MFASSLFSNLFFCLTHLPPQTYTILLLILKITGLAPTGPPVFILHNNTLPYLSILFSYFMSKIMTESPKYHPFQTFTSALESNN